MIALGLFEATGNSAGIKAIGKAVLSRGQGSTFSSVPYESGVT